MLDMVTLNGYKIKDEKAVRRYETVALMKADTKLKEGYHVKTKGYYESNDGGHGEYVIVDDDTLVDDGGSIHVLTNGLRAVLLIDNDTINFKQLGAKPNDNTYDNKNHLLTYQTICNTLDKQVKLIIPNGTWYFSPTFLSRIGGFDIEGIGGYAGRTFVAPVICAINNQDYIWKFGGLDDMGTSTIPYDNTNTGNKIKNLVFSTGENKINYGCLVLEYANYGFYDNLFFNNIIGTGLYIRSSWENYFGMLNFRSIADFSKPCLWLATARTISSVSGNISSSSFDKMIFENISGDMIYSQLGSHFVNNQINEINIENSWKMQEGETRTQITSEDDLTQYTPIFMFNGNMSGVIINTINYTGLNSYYYILHNGDDNYYFKSLFNSIGGGSTEGYRYDLIVGNIASRSLLEILTSINPYSDAFVFEVGNILISSNGSYTYHDFGLFDCKQTGRIKVGNVYSRSQGKTFGHTLLNTYYLYKYASQGTISSDLTSQSDLYLKVDKLPSGSLTRLGINYPYDHSSSGSSTWIIRTQADSTGRYSYVLRGTKNGENSNRTYTQSELEPYSWHNVVVTMDYDYNSPIILVNLAGSVDTLTFVSINQ